MTARTKNERSRRGGRVRLSLKKKLIFSLVVFSLFVIILEAGLRLAGFTPVATPDQFRLKVAGELLGKFDKELFWRLEGRSIAAAEGWRDAAIRVAVLTDSVAVMDHGRGYPRFVEQGLIRRLPGTRAVVYNGGVPGYSSFQGLRFLRTEILAQRPNVVVVCYGWNDHWGAINGLPDRRQDPASAIKLLDLSRHSAIVTFIATAGRSKQVQHPEPRVPDDQRRVPLADYRANLERIVAESRRAGALVILMTAPYLEAEANRGWIGIHRQYNEVTRKVARAQRTLLIDLTERFRRAEDLFLFPGEGDFCHYNTAGSRIVAGALVDLIMKNRDAIGAR